MSASRWVLKAPTVQSAVRRKTDGSVRVRLGAAAYLLQRCGADRGGDRLRK